MNHRLWRRAELNQSEGQWGGKGERRKKSKSKTEKKKKKKKKKLQHGLRSEPVRPTVRLERSLARRTRSGSRCTCVCSVAAAAAARRATAQRR
jgi:hypothetical protein